MTNPTLAVYLGAPQAAMTAAEFWADPSSWTDVTSSLSEVTWKRGRQGLLDSMGGGSGRLVFIDTQRDWEPTNPDGPNWPLSERQVKIEATLGTVTYPLFRGWTQEWDVAWDTAWESGTIATGKGGKSEVEVELVDAIGILSNWEIAGWGTVTEPGTVSMGTALMGELDQVGFQWGMRDIDTSSATQVVRIPDRGAVWTNVQDYVQSDLSLRQAWIDGRGYFFFGDGEAKSAVFGDGTGELPYGKTQSKWGLDLVFTDVSVTAAQPGAIDQRTAPTREGNPTPFLHGSRSKTLQTRNQSNADALTLSQNLWDRHWQPRARPGPIVVRPGIGNDSLWAALLDMELQDTFTFRRRPPGTGTWEQTLQVMGLAHSVRLTTADWTTTFDVAGEFVLFPAALVVDDFQRDAEGPPPAGWTAWSSTGLKIISNQLAPDDSGFNDAYWTASMTGPDVDAYVTISTLPATGGGTIIFARTNPTAGGGGAGNGYAVVHDVSAGTDTITMRRYDLSAGTDLGSWSQNLANGDGIGIRCRRSTIEAWAKVSGFWHFIGSVTDTTYAGTGSNVKVGLFNNGNGTSAARYDNFGAGNIPRAN